MNNRVLVGGLIGGITFFILGFLIYGIVLRTMMTDSMMPGLSRADDDMQYAFLILGNLLFGFFIAYILDKTNTVSAASGATIGGMVGLLMGLGGGFTSYGTSNTYTSLTGVMVDAFAIAIMCAVVGGVVGWWYSRGRAVAVA